MSTICRNKAVCVVVSVWNVCTMAQNSTAKMVIEASDVEGAAGGTGGVVGGTVEVASGISGVGAGGTNSMIADPLTKGLPPKLYHEHVAHMGVVHIDDVSE